ncbi:MAG TPA: hydantoinase/oxoprolinase N-terminal domain-containing protein [Solirubrobacteraceae bacterium]|nr:hydantoinase/oxoprolinase N-terminal domain-containing protein [Solirubrobacteraceae bacterium]
MPSSTRPPEVRLAVAAGAAITEAVAMDARDRMLAQAEPEPSDDLAAGVAVAIRRLLDGGDVDPARVSRVIVGAGHALARVVDERTVGRVAVIRIGGPLTHAVPPLAAWPDALRAALSAGVAVVGGGAEYDGRSVAPLDGEAIARFLAGLGDDVDGVAITGVFSPVAPDHELAACELVRRELGHGVHLSLSHELGTLGLIERENSAILNAALAGAARAMAADLQRVLRGARLDAEPFLSQNDGALMALDFAVRFPVLMLGSESANAMRGAAHLTGLDEAVVVHTAGGMTEVGAVVHGFPREAPSAADVAGIRMGFRMPDVRRLGPDAGGDALSRAVDRARADLRAPPVVAVGRDAGMVLDHLPGVGPVLRPDGGDVAAAVGAAIARVTGHADRICADRPDKRREALEAARDAAIARAVHAGADRAAVQVVEVDEAALTYDVEPAVRIRVKVAGPPA